MPITLDDLCAELPRHRAALKRAWSQKTIHRDYPYTPGDPTGQCGPTALWVTYFLCEYGQQARFASGAVAVGDRENVIITIHHWTVVHDYVIDLTGSQGEGIDDDVICATDTELQRRGIFYIPQSTATLEEISDPNLWIRYGALAFGTVRYLEDLLS